MSVNTPRICYYCHYKFSPFLECLAILHLFLNPASFAFRNFFILQFSSFVVYCCHQNSFVLWILDTFSLSALSSWFNWLFYKFIFTLNGEQLIAVGCGDNWVISNLLRRKTGYYLPVTKTVVAATIPEAISYVTNLVTIGIVFKTTIEFLTCASSCYHNWQSLELPLRGSSRSCVFFLASYRLFKDFCNFTLNVLIFHNSCFTLAGFQSKSLSLPPSHHFSLVCCFVYYHPLEGFYNFI